MIVVIYILLLILVVHVKATFKSTGMSYWIWKVKNKENPEVMKTLQNMRKIENRQVKFLKMRCMWIKNSLLNSYCTKVSSFLFVVERS